MPFFEEPTKPYGAYIFDCDGTLVDSMPLHLAAWNHGLEVAGAPLKLDGIAFMSVAGMALQQTIDHWNRTHKLQIDGPTVIRAKDAYFRSRMDSVQPISEVVAFAQKCMLAGARLAVASGGTRPDVLHSLKVIGLEDFFPVIVTAEDVALAKPAPDLFLLAAELLGADPADCLVLEDSLLGIQAANIAGMDSLLIPHPF